MRFANPKVVVALAPLKMPTTAAAAVPPTIIGIFPTALDPARFYAPREIEHFDTAAAHASASARALWARSKARLATAAQTNKQNGETAPNGPDSESVDLYFIFVSLLLLLLRLLYFTALTIGR
jgi:hypothetical protein